MKVIPDLALNWNSIVTPSSILLRKIFSEKSFYLAANGKGVL